MCSVFTVDCGYSNSNNNLIGNVYCPNTTCSCKLCLHTKKLLNLTAESTVNVRNARVCSRCVIFLLKIKQVPFSCRLVKGSTFWKRVQNQFKILLEMSFLRASIVSTKGCNSLDGYVTTLRSIYGLGKCGFWLVVHKVLCKLQEHVKTQKKQTKHSFLW